MSPRKKIISQDELTTAADSRELNTAIVPPAESRSLKAARAKPRAPRVKKRPVVSEPLPPAEEALPADYTSPSPRFYRTIAFGFLAVSALVVLAVIYLTANKATVTLELKERPLKIETLVNLAPKAEGQNQIDGLVVELPVKGEKKFAVSEGREVPAAASGRVVVYNKSSRNQPLVATTRLLIDGVLFRLKRGVTVPAKGQTEAEVYADKPGREGEIGPSKFSIPGLSEILQKDIYAESKAAMTGGVKFVSTLTAEEIKEAQDELAEQLFNEGRGKLEALVATSSLYGGRLFISYNPVTKTTAKPGDTATDFTMSGELKVAGFFYNPNDLNKILLESLQANLMDEERLVGSPSKPAVQLSKYDIAVKTAELKVTQEAVAQVDYSERLLDNERLLGQKKTAVEEYFKSLPWLEKAEIAIMPPWFSKLPRSISRLEIKVKE